MVMPGVSPNLSRAPAIFRCRGPVRNGLFGEAGISLLEVLFGAAIVGIAAVGVAAMFGTSHSLVPNFAASCPGPPVEAKLVTVMVRKVEISSPNSTDPQTQPVIVQTVIVRP